MTIYKRWEVIIVSDEDTATVGRLIHDTLEREYGDGVFTQIRLRELGELEF